MIRSFQTLLFFALSIGPAISVCHSFGEDSVKNQPPVAVSPAAVSHRADAHAKLRILLQTPVTIKFDKVSWPKAILQIIDTNHLPVTQQSRTILASIEKKLEGQQNETRGGDFQVTAEYEGVALRAVLNDLCRLRGEDLYLYWVVSEGLIEIGTLDFGDQIKTLSMGRPIVRVHDVTSLVPPADLPEAVDKPHPLVKAVLESSQTNLISLLLGDMKTADNSAYEGTATLLKSNQKTLLVVRHNFLAQHEVENLLEQLNAAVSK